MSNRALLIILDGFGIGKDSPFNAIENAQMPFYRSLLSKYPHSQLLTHGEAVGLPAGVMGNSEVGHMTMGAGRVIYQDLSRISHAIRDGSFNQNPALLGALQAGPKNGGKVHLMGLLSDGGVHSHIDHLLALLDLCVTLQIPRVSVHAFLDGRDTPPNSAPQYLEKLLAHPSFANQGAGTTRATLATLMGRFWAMDRDQRWERIAKAYAALTGQGHTETATPQQALTHAYSQGLSDEFIEPLIFSSDETLRDGDSILFFNFRSDRARQITRVLVDPQFQAFEKKSEFKPSAFTCMTTYDATLPGVQIAFPPQNLRPIFGEWLEEKGLSQCRIAETEKYAHVTFFFNGGREKPFCKEDRLLIPSPKDVATYDLKPEMSAFQVAQEAALRIQKQEYDFLLMNFANADMVGHTGNYEASVRALEALDTCLEKVIGTAEKSQYHVLLTADHGNAEEMRDEQGRIHTQHTLNPVPAIWISPNSSIAPQTSRKPLKDGSLVDIMPTLCHLMNIGIPAEVTGTSLLPK